MSDRLESELYFSILPEWVLDADLSDKAIRLYAVLARYADHRTHEAFPSRETLAQRMRCSARSVDRAALELIASGVITKRQRHNSSLVYTLRVSRGVDMGVQGGLSPVSRGVDKDGDLTITTELEPEELDLGKRSKSARAQQLPGEWKPEALDDFSNKYPGLDFRDEVDAFKNYHLAKGSVMKDWDAAFRTWLRNAKRWNSPRGQVWKPPADIPGVRDWVKKMHEMGEHFECRDGEFGCK
jgi:DNA-binding transcriptional MocR family regulator